MTKEQVEAIFGQRSEIPNATLVLTGGAGMAGVLGRGNAGLYTLTSAMKNEGGQTAVGSTYVAPADIAAIQEVVVNAIEPVKRIIT